MRSTMRTHQKAPPGSWHWTLRMLWRSSALAALLLVSLWPLAAQDEQGNVPEASAEQAGEPPAPEYSGPAVLSRAHQPMIGQGSAFATFQPFFNVSEFYDSDPNAELSGSTPNGSTGLALGFGLTGNDQIDSLACRNRFADPLVQQVPLILAHGRFDGIPSDHHGYTVDAGNAEGCSQRIRGAAGDLRNVIRIDVNAVQTGRTLRASRYTDRQRSPEYPVSRASHRFGFLLSLVHGDERARLCAGAAVDRDNRLIAIGERGGYGYVELILAGRDQTGEHYHRLNAANGDHG